LRPLSIQDCTALAICGYRRSPGNQHPSWLVSLAESQSALSAPIYPIPCRRLIAGALSAKEDGPMARLILTSLVLAIFIHPLYAQSSLYTDRSGYTTGTQDGRSVNTYTDRYGNTTGWVGGKYQNTYSDGYGGTTGTLGNKRINTYDDGYGNTTGTIGRDRINLHTDRSGVTTGTVGQRRLNCYSNRFSTTCY
jgi:hypothetical protein